MKLSYFLCIIANVVLIVLGQVLFKLGVGKEGMTFSASGIFSPVYQRIYNFRAFYLRFFNVDLVLCSRQRKLKQGLSGAKPVLCSYGSGVGGVFQRKSRNKKYNRTGAYNFGRCFFGKRIEKLAYIQCILYKMDIFTLFIQKSLTNTA